MTIDPNLVKAATESKVVEKVYDDLFSQPIKEVSKIVTWLIKTLQIPFYPIQMTAAWQERLENRLKNSVEKVTPENLVKPPESFFIPIVNQLSYMEEGNVLVDLFQNLLARSMDKTRNTEAHPAFISIINQLSPDEALILSHLKSNSIKTTLLYDYNRETNKFTLNCTEEITFPVDSLTFSHNFDMYLNHLEHINLICVINADSEPLWNAPEKNEQIGERKTLTLSYTLFGNLFIKACFT